MNIFSEVKEYLTARQVAENYGLQVRRNGLACCPFHDDKHPSMKIDKNYHCFACGVGGDAIDYVSRMFDLSQYEAALKIVEDFRLPIEIKGNKELSEQDRERIRRERTERERLIHIREHFDRWCNHSIESLRDSLSLIEQMSIFLNGKPPDIIFSEDYAQMLQAEPIMNYYAWVVQRINRNFYERQEGGGRSCRESQNRKRTYHGTKSRKCLIRK